MPERNIQIQPGSLEIQASTHTGGDGEFFGHGPNMYLNANLYLANEYQIGLTALVRFEETESDWTTWQGNYNGIIYDVRSGGEQFKITRIVTPPLNVVQQLNGYGEHNINLGAGGIFQTLVAVGDSNGGIFGSDDKPRVNMIFNNIVIEEEAPPRDRANWLKTTIPQLRLQPREPLRPTPRPD